jgi:putative OPT family oligopeptide transporter
MRELSAATLLLAIVLAVVMAAANAYLGLFAATTVSASIPAAVVSMGVLRFFGGNILQNNIVQTAATSGEGVAGGVIFTVPALVLLGTWSDFHYWETTALAAFGGLLGVLFTIPLRRAMIIEQPLRFPEGVATAEVLKAGHEGGAGLGRIAAAAAAGGLFKLGGTGLRLWQETAAVAVQAGKPVFYLGTQVSPALVAVGTIVGLNVAVLVFLGGVANFLVAVPIYSATHHVTGGDAMAMAGTIWSEKTRYLGVGAMLAGGLWTLVTLTPSLARGIRASLARATAKGDAAPLRTELDVPFRWVATLVLASIVPLTFVFLHFVGSVGLAIFMALFVVVAGFLFSAVAAYMAGIVGSSNNPISGVTIATVLSAAVLLKLLGMDGNAGPAAAIFVGSAVCCAAAMGGDTMQDLKAGHLLGSTPWKQQLMQAVGVVAAVFVMAPVLDLLNQAYTIGSKDLVAAQASLMAEVARGIFRGDLPWEMIFSGAGVAAGVIAIDAWLGARKASFRAPVMAFAVGIYLPVELATPIFAGGVIAHLASRAGARRGASAEAATAAAQDSLLFAAGLITGEALMGILLAIPIVVLQDTAALALLDAPPMWLGLVLLIPLLWWMKRVATPAGATRR